MNFKLVRKISLVGITLFFPFFVHATILDFNVDPSYDYAGREKVTAFIYQIGTNAYFFVEQDYYDKLTIEKKQEFSDNIKELSQEFDAVIYPKITGFYGSEWKSGIDKDNIITVLLTQIKGENGGYFNPADEYPVAQSPTSNEKEMVYLNVAYVTDKAATKAYLAHELVHLITFNQKERIHGVQEETWLNEMRAELAPFLLGYYDDYQGSILQRRVRDFAQKPNDSLTEWSNSFSDYGSVSLFGHYFLENYGIKVLKDSLASDRVGIPSLEEALKNNSFNKSFFRIFSDWLVAVFVNDCSLRQYYCYSNQNLKNLRIVPQLNYLPSVGESTLTVTDYSKDWSGSWVKFIGGKGTLKLDFIGEEKANYIVPYILQDKDGNYSVSFLDLGKSERGTVYISDFGTKYSSLTMIPSLYQKLSGFSGIESYHQFIWSASVINNNSEENEELIQQLLVQIEYLKAEIIKIQAKIAAILGQKDQTVIACRGFNKDLGVGSTDNTEVRCLQEFLKNQDPDIYPAGLVTGNFLSLTREAVIRFQNKYAEEILIPLGLEQGTGYFGQKTREMANKLIHK
ncbi:MAG: hypothetical protein ABH831_01785 [Candidatus Nealsonbacteria bacterium]